MLIEATLILSACAFIASLGQYPLVAHYVRTRGPARTEELVTQLLADEAATAPLIERLVAAAAPNLLRGGVDPTEAANARWTKAEEKATTKAAIFAWLAGQLGPERANMAMGVIPRDIMDTAIRAGDRWQHVLEPILDKVVAGQAHAAGSKEEPAQGVWSE